MHDVIRGSGDQIQLTVFPEDFIIEPDPASGGGGAGPRPPAVGDVLIVAALPDPLGADADRESVTVLNTTAARIDLNSWRPADTTSRQDLGGVLDPGSTLCVRLDAVQLGNRGYAVEMGELPPAIPALL